MDDALNTLDFKAQQTTMIAWFSGTGGTEMAANELEKQLKKLNHKVCNCPIEREEKCCIEAGINEALTIDRLYVMFPVYAFGAPQIVLDWCQKLTLNPKKVSVISVSGGGEVWPNTVCRVELIKLLIEKGLDVDYERMLVMPINLTFPKSESLNQHLIRILPAKIEHMIHEIENGKIRRNRLPLTTPLLQVVTHYERNACKKASKYFKINDSCIKCGKCAAYCPTKNMVMTRGEKPIFKDQCLMCLRCVYTCPVTAIGAPGFQKWILSEGFDIKQMADDAQYEPVEDQVKASKGILFIGVKKYLTEIEF